MPAARVIERSGSRQARIPAHAGGPDRRARPLAAVRNVYCGSHAAGGRLPAAKGAHVLMRTAPAAAVAAARVAGARGSRAAAPPAQHEFVQAVEFPYYLYPRTLWERELVWLKTIGIRTVEFSIPWNWHQMAPGDFDFTGRTSPRRDLVGFIKLLRRLGSARLGAPAAAGGRMAEPAAIAGRGADAARPRRPGNRRSSSCWRTQTASHGGPIAFVEGARRAWMPPPPPSPVTTSPANDPEALARSRAAIAGRARRAAVDRRGRRALSPPAGRAGSRHFLRKGAVGLSGRRARRRRGACGATRALLRPGRRCSPRLQPAASAQARGR